MNSHKLVQWPLPAALAESFALALKNYQDAARSEREMHALTKSPAAHRLVLEHRVKCQLRVHEVFAETLRFLESEQP